ncbi:hypothetical protein ACHAXT_006973 [Thalassiosira profunda]
MEQDEEPIPLEQLYEDGAAIRDGHSKSTTIIRSSMAIVSIISSSLVVWMITRRTKSRLSSIYHRLLLGMSIADILFSLGLATFNAVIPSDEEYVIWNAKGNVHSCNFDGFIIYLGACGGLIYSCSLNVYYLLVVKHRKTDEQIKRKYEPYLHGVPIVYAVVCASTLLAKRNINSDGKGMCFVPVYDPLHCIGYEDGEIRDGFEIPCGRGRDGAVLFSYIGFFATLLTVPIIISILLGMIYRSVRQQEKRMERYEMSAATASEGRSSTSLKSRAVLHRAVAYSVAYFLTWAPAVIRVALLIAGVEWTTALWYLTSFLSPLQGFYNLLIFMQPKVLRARDNTTWCRAFVVAFQGSTAVGSGRGNSDETPQDEVPTKSSNSGEEKSSESNEEQVIVQSDTVIVRRRSSEII